MKRREFLKCLSAIAVLPTLPQVKAEPLVNDCVVYTLPQGNDFPLQWLCVEADGDVDIHLETSLDRNFSNPVVVMRVPVRKGSYIAPIPYEMGKYVRIREEFPSNTPCSFKAEIVFTEKVKGERNER